MAVYGSKDMGIGNAILFDGSEIRRSPVEVGSLSHYLEGVLIAGFLNHQQYFAPIINPSFQVMKLIVDIRV